MLTRMQKNPNRVTRFGASHSGRSLTKAFHFNLSAAAIDNKVLFVHSALERSSILVTYQRWSICSSEDSGVPLAKEDLLLVVSFDYSYTVIAGVCSSTFCHILCT